MRIIFVFVFIFLVTASISPFAQNAYAQIGKTPEETLSNVVRHVRSLPAKEAFGAVCDSVEWDLMYAEIKSKNEKFLVKEKISSSDDLKRYVNDSAVTIVDGAKVLVLLSENPFLMGLFTKTMKVSGRDDVGNLAGMAVQYADEGKGKAQGLSFGKVVADLDKPADYLNFSVLSKDVIDKGGEVLFHVLVTDLRTNHGQVIRIPLVRTGGEWYLKSYMPEGLCKNFNTGIDSVDMQRLIKLARVLKKF